MIACSNCGTENTEGRKFCRACGTPLAVVCGVCATANSPGDLFCGECGAQLEGAATPSEGGTMGKPSRAGPVAERRMVSVLFADLVGFTALAESRDAEEVRDLLTRYFDTCRSLIARYGGVVEKFIGDAVMAVWGAPVAREDDAERAVRAALDLAGAVHALGEEVGEPEVRIRAGVLTGEAAVTIGAEGQGMVAGDLVNTASRVQATATPGAVLVGESTKRATEAAIEYEDAGAHELKGKTEPMSLWRAVRVIGLRGGALRSVGIEPPFVGRDRELRLIKELFHASTEERTAHLVSVIGVGGIGKSRIAWEIEKYIDGLATEVWWHRGRCLAYGEGVAFWALAEMVRMRAGIAEEEESRSAARKLSATVEQLVPDAEERRYIEPRLAHLLGLEDRGTGDQENLFAAWRIFFERIAERSPLVMVFEDLHWADSALLDFIEYLLDWSRDHPIFVLTLARPEFTDRRPTWGAGKRNFTSLFLEPLPPGAMDELLTRPVPGLPEELREKILERAEGIPFYAVETVRMLLDRGLLVREGNEFRPTGPINTLEVPESLHALIAARLDGLEAEERAVLQDAAVLGKTFFKQGVAALSGLPEDHVGRILGSLVGKEVLTLQADPRSPERGQYGFLQDLVRKVAYDTMARRTRKEKQLAAASYLESAWAGEEEDDIVEVLAAHYLDAYEAVPDAADAPAIVAKARRLLVRAAERATSLGASAEAQRYLERAIELTDEPLERAELHERAGVEAATGARSDDATQHFERSIALFEAERASHPAARVSARLAEMTWQRGRLEEGLDLMDRSLQVLTTDEPDEDLASLMAQVARFHYFAGDVDVAGARIEAALEIAEALGLPEVLSQALNTKSLVLLGRGRLRESEALLTYALAVALEHDKPTAALRAYNNLVDFAQGQDRYEVAESHRQQGLTLARKVGNRFWESVLATYVYPLFAMGRWDDTLATLNGLREDWRQLRSAVASQGLVACGAAINVHRGDLDGAELITKQFSELERSADIQERAEFAAGSAALLLGRGHPAEALAAASAGLEHGGAMSMGHMTVKESFVTAVEAALQLGRLDKVEELLALVEELPPARRPLFLEGHATRFRAILAARRGSSAEAEQGFLASAGLFRELAVPFALASALLDHAEWLGSAGHFDRAEPLADEARSIFDSLGATPWLERLHRVRAPESLRPS